MNEKKYKISRYCNITPQLREHIPYGSDKTGGEGTIWETQKKATLTNTCTAKQIMFRNQPLNYTSFIQGVKKQAIKFMDSNIQHQHVWYWCFH